MGSPVFQPAMNSIRPASAVSVPGTRGHTGRLVALDFTKGALVVLMVLYHWLNYFVNLEDYYYRYIRFLTPSFIFITGFLISHVYLRDARSVDRHVPHRLLFRGVKLLVIFAALNGILSILPSATGPSGVTDWSVYIGQSTSDSRVSFFVLLPIAYLLIGAAGLSVVSNGHPATLPIAAAASITVAGVWQIIGRPNAIIELLSIGLVGTLIGNIELSRLTRLMNHRAAILTAYGVYLCAITLWHEVYVLQLVGVCITLALIYAAGATWNSRVADHVVLLGKYSLFGYIAQVAILRFLLQAVQHTTGNALVALVCLAIGFGLTLLSVLFVHWARAHNDVVNKTYSTVFS